MALFDPAFVGGILVLLYLLSFVAFAVLRIATGISIQRLGWFSLRRVAFTPRDGCKIEIRGLGLAVHRPTFAQPTWISLKLQEVAVTLDVRQLEAHKQAEPGDDDEQDETDESSTDASIPRIQRTRPARRNKQVQPRSETWKRLVRVKERIKQLHVKLNWLRMVDVVATNCSVNVVDVGTVQIGSLALAVDTRQKTVDRMRFFFRSSGRRQARQAEWSINLKSVLFTADGRESEEILDHGSLNIHGYLDARRAGLRDAAVSLKLGRLNIPLDDVEVCRAKYKLCKHDVRDPKTPSADEPLDAFLGSIAQEVSEPGTTNDDLMRTVSDSKEFFSSLLRGIKEVQLILGHAGVNKKIDSIRPNAKHDFVLLSAAMREVGVDLHRLEPHSPAHRMYFSPNDIAHEATAAALSISVGLDDGHGKVDRIIYVPLATITVRTTLPSKTVEYADDAQKAEKNANIMFANGVVTSPSIDLDPRQLPVIIALLQAQPKMPKPETTHRHNLISRLLPKASVKLSMHEPVVRIKLKPLAQTEDPDDFDLIISSISSISVDVESSHALAEDSHYSIDGTLRLQSHDLYYQTHAAERFNLITTDLFDLRMHLGATPNVSVDASGSIQSLSISLVRPEITDGLRQIVRELRIDVEPTKKVAGRHRKKDNLLRTMPTWLTRFAIEATDFNIEVAGIDDDISEDVRGLSLHVEALATEYTAQQRLDSVPRPIPRRRTHSRSMTFSDSDATPSPYSSKPKYDQLAPGDGRRFSFHAQGIDVHIMESPGKLEVEPLLAVPELELVLNATSDRHGALFQVQVLIRSVMVNYSLFRHYSVGVAVMTVRKAFMRRAKDVPRAKQEGSASATERLAPPNPDTDVDFDPLAAVASELVTVDVKVSMVQIKADMPHDPRLMLHVYGLETGRHRWSTPFFNTKMVRLYAEAPRMKGVWAKMVGIKGGKLDIKTSKRKSATGKITEEKLIDITSEATRFAVPSEVIVYRIVDNCINTSKAVLQLFHRFRTGTNEYILDKQPEGPKNVPKISIRSRNFLFELEDGPFEWKLGMIYRTGKAEQVQRLAREEAFWVKLRRVREEQTRRGSKGRSRSAHHRGRTNASAGSWFRSRSLDYPASSEDPLAPSKGRGPRYRPDEESQGINGQSKVSEAEARYQLDFMNSQSWKKRIDRACQQCRDSVHEERHKIWGADEFPADVGGTETILSVPDRPSLMAAHITDLQLHLDKPSFPLAQLPDFLHKVGKGMPKDMQYSLLVPMHITLEVGEARSTLRDYPLPILHIPALKYEQSKRQPAMSLKTDFVLGEEFRGPESTRKILVNIVPPKKEEQAGPSHGGFAIEVRRTVAAVKSFSNVFMNINTAHPTRLTWGPCYQPAVQDMMMVIESFTKPPIDPSERLGFWDKLRLVFHSHLHISWKGDGDVHLGLKGTRDPYAVTGNGAGFLMCWRNNVRWNVNVEDDPKRFMTVDSGEYVLAIPDYSHYIRESHKMLRDGRGGLGQEEAYKSGAIFKKVVMKLSGKVQWMAGIVFERAIEDGRRSFDFKPHHEIVLKNPVFAKPDGDLPYDAMRGFRSRHIHLSIAIRAPVDRDWSADTASASRSYNTVHLTPRFFTHFFTWWGLFGQPLSLPIRQGSLFPGREKNSKKFGRHLATVKYNLLLAPLFMSHIYKHKDAEDYSENSVSATGLKVRFDSFMLDIHQRREQFNTLGRGRNGQGRTTGMKIHAAQLDLASADLRAVSASLKGTTTEAIKKGQIDNLVTDQDEKPDLSRFTIPDHDFSWIDMDDFVELDWILPTEPHPDTKILPLAYTPMLTYVRQTDIGNTIAGDPTRTSPFGHEPTHFCIMTHDDEPKQVQAKLVEERLSQLLAQMNAHQRVLGEAELRVVRGDIDDPESISDLEALKKHTYVLREKKTFLENMASQMKAQTRSRGKGHCVQTGDKNGDEALKMNDETLNIPATAEFESEFTNRFVVHNMQLKWNNVLRNIVLRYIHQNGQRRGFIYYLSRPAVKFILDIVEEQNRAKANQQTDQPGSAKAGNSSPESSTKAKTEPEDLEDRINNFLGGGRRFNSASFAEHNDGSFSGNLEDIKCGISEEFVPQSSYHLRLIAPQIQLQSDKNKKNVALITAKGMELKVLEVMDRERASDTVSGLVQRRFSLNMDSTQFFVTHQKWFHTHLVSMYAGSRYGTPQGSSWPPWVPMEVMFDFETDPFGFKRVVQKTSAMLRYDKYNNLRLKYNDEVNTEGDAEAPTAVGENRMDNLWVEFPQARAICNSSQYYALYVIVLDLLMYSEPLEKTRSERLEKIMLASDFSDLSGAPAMVQRLQERVRSLEEIKHHFQVYSQYLDRRGWEDRLALERDLAQCEDELFFVMKAITTSQRKMENSDNALLKWSICAREIVWHLMQDAEGELVELQLKSLQYDRTDNSDGSHTNLVRVGKILGLNLLKDAVYPEIIAPYHDEETYNANGRENKDMIRVYWYMLEAIAGIPVMDTFEVDLFPMKVQLEREVGQRLLRYIFPGIEGEKEGGSKRESPFMVKSNIPALNEPETDDDDGSSTGLSKISSSRLSVNSSDKDSGFSTRAGSLELRLRPTLTSTQATLERPQRKALHVNTGEGSGNGFRLFRSSGTGKTSLSKKSSYDSLRGQQNPKSGNIPRSSTGLSLKTDKETGERKARFGLRGRSEKQPQSDDLTQMIDRASNYMTFATIKMSSVVLCVSYKGKETRNLEDVHDFVFRLPTLEWHNKTWSNLDLAMAFKRAMVKALLSHSGALIGNKLSWHRQTAEQRNRLRELANSSVLIAPSAPAAPANSAGSVNDSDDSSLYDGVDWSRSPPRSTRSSTYRSIPAPTSRSSSIASAREHRRASNTPTPGMPSFLTRTPPTPVEGPSRSNTDANSDSVEIMGSSTGDGMFGMPHRQLLRGATGSTVPDRQRPATSHSAMTSRSGMTSHSAEQRRRSGANGLRDRLSAFTHRMRESSIGDDGGDNEPGEEESQTGIRKRMSWVPTPSSRTKTS